MDCGIAGTEEPVPPHAEEDPCDDDLPQQIR